MGTLGAFWSYENMGINDLAAHEFMKEVLLSAPYMGGKGQSSPTEQSRKKVSPKYCESHDYLKRWGNHLLLYNKILVFFYGR